MQCVTTVDGHWFAVTLHSVMLFIELIGVTLILYRNTCSA